MTRIAKRMEKVHADALPFREWLVRMIELHRQREIFVNRGTPIALQVERT